MVSNKSVIRLTIYIGAPYNWNNTIKLIDIIKICSSIFSIRKYTERCTNFVPSKAYSKEALIVRIKANWWIFPASRVIIPSIKHVIIGEIRLIRSVS